MPVLALSRIAREAIIHGDGRARMWRRMAWRPLSPVGQGPATAYATRFKACYSATALYVLCDCEDRRLTCTNLPDGGDLFREDVIELFIWPDTAHPLYFEYEISPLGAELAILVPNRRGTFIGWQPWHYENTRVTRRATSVRGGPKRPGARVSGWTVEFCIPFDLLVGVCDPPRPGDTWRANVYRIDYDTPAVRRWAWCTRTGENFHDFRNFGRFTFA